MKSFKQIDVARFHDMAFTAQDVKLDARAFYVTVAELGSGLFHPKLYQMEFHTRPFIYKTDFWAQATIRGADGDILSKDVSVKLKDRGIIRNHINDNIAFNTVEDAMLYMTFVLAQRAASNSE